MAKIAEIQLLQIPNKYESSIEKITCSKDAFTLLDETWDRNSIAIQESFRVILLNNANKVIGIYEHSKGGMTGTVVDIRLILSAALKSLSVAMILSHCHPSGTLKPSQADKDMTEKIKTAATYMDIKVLDHLILTPDHQFYSFADSGLLP